jgi:hypothetical protein
MVKVSGREEPVVFALKNLQNSFGLFLTELAKGNGNGTVEPMELEMELSSHVSVKAITSNWLVETMSWKLDNLFSFVLRE